MYAKQNRSRLGLFAGLIILTMIGNTFTALAAEVRGVQSGRWTISGSPYVVTGNIVIPEGATLTIEPGVIIKFAGYYSFKVKGTLRALGNPANRIVFTSADDSEFNDASMTITNPATVNDWIGIEFTDSSIDEQSRFENCVIRYCTTPLALTQAFPRKLEGLTITNCSSKFVNLNGHRVPYQNGVELDYIVKDTVYQAAAPEASSDDDTLAAAPDSDGEAISADEKSEADATPAASASANGNGSAAAANTEAAMLQGIVTDAETNESLPKATIEVVSVDGKITRGAASGANGEFDLQNLPPGLYAVTVSYLGYARRTVEDVVLAAGEFRALDIPMSPTGIEFNPIAFTASKRPKKVFAAPAAISVIEAGDIATRSTLTTAEHVRAMPAVDFAATGLNQMLVSLRGFNNVFTGALLPLTDHRVARLPALRLNAFNLISTTNDDIERIELVSGPSSALYGPNSANGVMHVITKSPFGSEGTTLSAGGGERIGFFGSLRHAGSFNNRLGYKISGQYYKGKDWENFDAQEPDSFVIDGNKIPAPGRDFNVEKIGGEGRVDFRLNQNLTAVLTGGLSRVDGIELTGVGAMQAKDYYSGFLQGRVGYKNFFAQGVINRIEAGYSYLLRTGAPVVDKSSAYISQIQHNFALGRRQRFTYGVDYLQTRPESRATIYGRNEYTDHVDEIGAFLQSETALTRKLNFTGALRVDQHNRLKDLVFSPRAALVYNLNAERNLRFTFNRAFNTPATDQFFLDLVSGSIPQTPFVLRAFGVPDKTGLTFARGGDRLPLMLSPFAQNTGYLPATVNAVWPALRGMLIAGSTADLQTLLEAALPAELEATVLGDLRRFNPATAGFEPVAEAQDAPPLKPTITNTFEAGYKGLLNEKFLVAIEVYHTRVENFVSPLIVETPNVFANAAQLAAALQSAQAALAEALASQGMTTEEARAQAGAIVDGLVNRAAQIPFGVLSPQELAGATEVILTYRNFGDIALTGADFSFTYHAGANWKISGNYSYVSKNFFPQSAAQPHDIALNAPQHKIGLSVQRGNLAKDLNTQFRLRYVEGFPVNSGVYRGAVQTYAVVDLDCSYDLAAKTKFFFAVQNILDRRYREFAGAPLLGRLVLARLSHSL
jgi:iron complex outermembrane receptor protein